MQKQSHARDGQKPVSHITHGGKNDQKRAQWARKNHHEPKRQAQLEYHGPVRSCERANTEAALLPSLSPPCHHRERPPSTVVTVHTSSTPRRGPATPRLTCTCGRPCRTGALGYAPARPHHAGRQRPERHTPQLPRRGGGPALGRRSSKIPPTPSAGSRPSSSTGSSPPLANTTAAVPPRRPRPNPSPQYKRHTGNGPAGEARVSRPILERTQRRGPS